MINWQGGGGSISDYFERRSNQLVSSPGGGRLSEIRAVTVKKSGLPPWTAIKKLRPPLPEILIFGPAQSPVFQSFLAPQLPEFPHGPT